MVMQDIKSMKEKNRPASRAILKAMRIRRYNANHISQYGRSLDAAIGPVFALYRPGECHGHQFRHKKLSCGIVEITFQS